jgi:LysM repeat protein
MKTKSIFRLIMVLAILLTAFASTGSALAWSGCNSYITVQWGDTLSGLAAYCGTSVEAIRAANPGIGWWIYAGQVLYVPNGYNAPYHPPVSSTGGSYIIRWGDTLGNIAAKNGISLHTLLAANPQIWNASLIYPGQVITLPATSYAPPYVPPSSTYVPPAPITNVQNFSATLTVIAVKGVNIRNQPNYDGKIILADDYTKGGVFSYRPDSITKDDAHRRTWVEVVISQSGNTYTKGWLPVSGPQDYLNHTGPIEDWVTPHIE